MKKFWLLSFAALMASASVASAQTAGGPAYASPGAMPSDTPLTSSGAVRGSASAATQATPSSVGAHKPARPRRARHHVTSGTPAITDK